MGIDIVLKIKKFKKSNTHYYYWIIPLNYEEDLRKLLSKIVIGLIIVPKPFRGEELGLLPNIELVILFIYIIKVIYPIFGFNFF